MNIRIKLWFQNSTDLKTTAENTICDSSQRKSSIYTWWLLCHSYEVTDQKLQLVYVKWNLQQQRLFVHMHNHV